MCPLTPVKKAAVGEQNSKIIENLRNTKEMNGVYG